MVPRPLQPLRFLWQFMANPITTGAVAPSSRQLAEAMVAEIGLPEARTIAEFGAGTGSFTRLILDHADPDANILSFEINPSMADMLGHAVPGVHVIVDSAAKLGHYLQEHGLSEVDCVICGLPWASFSDGLQNELLAALDEHVLGPDRRRWAVSLGPVGHRWLQGRSPEKGESACGGACA